jgi:hypothetical protein
MDLQAIIRRAVEIGDQHGFITFNRLNEFVPSSADPEDIEALLEAFSARGISVTEA